jgi:hypothetical protein
MGASSAFSNAMNGMGVEAGALTLDPYFTY